MLGWLHHTDALLFKCIGHVSAHGRLSDDRLMMLLRAEGHVVGRNGWRLGHVLAFTGACDGLPLGATGVHV